MIHRFAIPLTRRLLLATAVATTALLGAHARAACMPVSSVRLDMGGTAWGRLNRQEPTLIAGRKYLQLSPPRTTRVEFICRPAVADPQLLLTISAHPAASGYFTVQAGPAAGVHTLTLTGIALNGGNDFEPGEPTGLARAADGWSVLTGESSLRLTVAGARPVERVSLTFSGVPYWPADAPPPAALTYSGRVRIGVTSRPAP